MKKIFTVLLVLAIAAAGSTLFLFHSKYKNWKNIHPNLVYQLRGETKKSWYPLVARVLNFPGTSEKTAQKRNPNEGVGGSVMPKRSFLSGSLEVKLEQGGFYYLEAIKKYSPGATLIIYNHSKSKAVETLFNVEMVDPERGTIYYRTRKFINVKPGGSMKARFGAREEVVFARPGDAPTLVLRISLPNGFERSLPIPKRLRRPQK